jgi:hypothetical protein
MPFEDKIISMEYSKPKVYLPPKGQEWNDTSTLGEDEDVIEYEKPFGDMNILNEEEVKDAVYPPVDEDGEYHHKDGKFRHPETLYITPGVPKHRSDSLSRG